MYTDIQYLFVTFYSYSSISVNFVDLIDHKILFFLYFFRFNNRSKSLIHKLAGNPFWLVLKDRNGRFRYPLYDCCAMTWIYSVLLCISIKTMEYSSYRRILQMLKLYLQYFMLHVNWLGIEYKTNNVKVHMFLRLI